MIVICQHCRTLLDFEHSGECSVCHGFIDVEKCKVAVVKPAAQRPQYLYIETERRQQFGVSESIDDYSSSDFDELQKGQLRCFRFIDGHFEELVGGTNWEPVKNWYRT